MYYVKLMLNKVELSSKNIANFKYNFKLILLSAAFICLQSDKLKLYLKQQKRHLRQTKSKTRKIIITLETEAKVIIATWYISNNLNQNPKQFAFFAKLDLKKF